MSKLVEEWRPVVGYEDLYEVSDWGNVRSVDRIIVDKNGREMHYKGRILKGAIHPNNGYKMVLLGVGRPNMVHRLVAKAFIPNPENKREVDHIIPTSDGGTDDVWNLRWATTKENANNPKSAVKRYRKHSEETRKKLSESRKDKKAVNQYTLDGKYFSTYESLHKAAKTVGGTVTSISRCCNGKQKKYKGFIWKYK